MRSWSASGAHLLHGDVSRLHVLYQLRLPPRGCPIVFSWFQPGRCSAGLFSHPVQRVTLRPLCQLPSPCSAAGRWRGKPWVSCNLPTLACGSWPHWPTSRLPVGGTYRWLPSEAPHWYMCPRCKVSGRLQKTVGPGLRPFLRTSRKGLFRPLAQWQTGVLVQLAVVWTIVCTDLGEWVLG